MTTFVSVGNATQPFYRLIEAVTKISSKLPQPIVIQHGNTSLYKADIYIDKPFLEMSEFSSLVRQAELLILHAGAGSVIHAIQAGKIPVIMPRRKRYDEHIDDHQYEFSNALAKTGKVVLAKEPDDLIEAVDVALNLQIEKRFSNTEPQMLKLINESLRKKFIK